MFPISEPGKQANAGLNWNQEVGLLNVCDIWLLAYGKQHVNAYA